MSKSIKIWLTVSALLVILGTTVLALTACLVGWDFTRLSSEKHETNIYDINEDFSNISMDTDTADIFFVPSDDGKCKVVCYENEKEKHSVSVQDGTLIIESVDLREWHEYINFNFETMKITVYLPKTEYTSLFIKASTGDIEVMKDFKFENIDISLDTGDVKMFFSATETVKIATDTGDIHIEGLSAGSLDLSVSTGKVTASDVKCDGDFKLVVSSGKSRLTNVTCKILISNGSTGDIFLNNVIAAEKFSIERSTGDVTFDGCDAAEIFIQTDTGDVEGSLLSDKIFITETSTRKIKVPSSVTGGKCEITTSTGNIKINIKQ